MHDLSALYSLYVCPKVCSQLANDDNSAAFYNNLISFHKQIKLMRRAHWLAHEKWLFGAMPSQNCEKMYPIHLYLEYAKYIETTLSQIRKDDCGFFGTWKYHSDINPIENVSGITVV